MSTQYKDLPGYRKPTPRKRPKVGDKDPNYKPKKPRKPPTSSKPKPAKRKQGVGSTYRDYRGTMGAVEDAQRRKKKK